MICATLKKMYKFSHHLSNAKLVLVRKQIGDPSCAALIVMRAPIRRFAQLESDKCPPQPQKARPKSYKLLIGTIGIGLLTGGAVVYAKSSPQARNWLESNAPWANDFVALVYQENTTYWKFTRNQLNNIYNAITGFIFGKEGVPTLEIPARHQQDLDKDAEKAFAKKDYALPPREFEQFYTEKKKVPVPEVETPANVIQTEKCEPAAPIEVKITKDTVQLEHDMHENTKVAIENYMKATKQYEAYNKALYKIIEVSVENLDSNAFKALQAAQTERDIAIKKAQEASGKAKCAIETLDRLIKTNQIQAPPESLTVTKRAISQFRDDLQKAEDAYKMEKEKSVISDKFWCKVEEARKAYKDELQILFPGIDIAARQLNFKGDTDLLLLYTLKQIQILQIEIAELQTVLDLKIKRAIECHDEKALIEAKVEETLNKERLLKEMEFQKRVLEIQAEANRRLKEELKRQSEVNLEVLQSKLAKKEKEMQANLKYMVSEQVEKERVIFKKEMAAMAGKMKAIEQTLKQRAKAEEEAKRSQSLWAAAEALLAATRRCTPEAKIDNEIKALEKAGKDDKLVQTVLKGIPSEAREKGIVTERSLREKFDTMEKTAVKVALIGRDGATLPLYFLSWLQSKLLFQSFSEIPTAELDNLPTDFTTLDTFDIIQRAKYHMDHGNLVNALRYVNLLQGAPRAAAKAWVDAARRHLEIRQAAETVMAHASVSGLLYL